MLAVEELLGRLEGVKSRGAGKWVARCPAHEDSDPSLAIRVTNDKMLVYCFAGCSPANICAAVGIETKDLFFDTNYESDPMAFAKAKKAVNDKFQSELDIHRTALALAKSDRENGKKLSPQDLERERNAYLALRDAGVESSAEIALYDTWERYK